MICGALQTLNEEACEDVLEEADEQVSNSLQVPDSGQLTAIQILENCPEIIPDNIV